MKPTFILSILLATAALSSTARSQLVFSAPFEFSQGLGAGLFEEQGGVVSRIETGFGNTNLPSVSRDGRFITFTTPDPVVNQNIPPSSDIYRYDRVTRAITKIFNYSTGVAINGATPFDTPLSTALSPNNQLLAFGVQHTRRSAATGDTDAGRDLNIVNVNTGLIIDSPTFGRGPVSDALNAEFIGISWSPDGNSFVTPMYTPVPTAFGQVASLPAINRFTFNSATGRWASTPVSQPRYFDNRVPADAEAHIFPALSPDGSRLAYFNVYWPHPVNPTEGVFSSLVVANADGSNAQVFNTFAQGWYPMGLTWTPDGNQLIFSIAPQQQSPIGFLASGDATQARLRVVSGLSPSNPVQPRPNIDFGFSPSLPLAGGSGTSNPVDLSQVKPSLTRSGNGFILRAVGLDPGETYRLESSTNLQNFPNGQNFTGQEFANGITIPIDSLRKVFRIRAIP